MSVLSTFYLLACITYISYITCMEKRYIIFNKIQLGVGYDIDTITQDDFIHDLNSGKLRFKVLSGNYDHELVLVADEKPVEKGGWYDAQL